MTTTQLTLGQAAKEAGINKSTLSRYVSQGKISAEKMEDGSYRIDASELDRIATLRATLNGSGNSSETHSMQQSETQGETSLLQREIALLREQLRDKEETIRDLRTMNAEERQERQRILGLLESQTRLLTHAQEQERKQQEESEPPTLQRPWWKLW